MCAGISASDLNIVLNDPTSVGVEFVDSTQDWRARPKLGPQVDPTNWNLVGACAIVWLANEPQSQALILSIGSLRRNIYSKYSFLVRLSWCASSKAIIDFAPATVS